MKDFLYHYIDFVTLAIGLFITVYYSIKAWKRSGKTKRLGVLMVLFLGPVLLITCMSTHLLEITYHAVDSNFTGKFSLRFHLYSLYLMAFVLGEAGRRFFLGITSFLYAANPTRLQILKPLRLVLMILLPLLWLTPLASLMLIVCALSIGASFLVNKPVQAANHEQEALSLEGAVVI